jgi:hypothetical protein
MIWSLVLLNIAPFSFHIPVLYLKQKHEEVHRLRTVCYKQTNKQTLSQRHAHVCVLDVVALVNIM